MSSQLLKQCVSDLVPKKHPVFFQFVLDQCSEEFFVLASGILPMIGCISRDNEHLQRRGPRFRRSLPDTVPISVVVGI